MGLRDRCPQLLSGPTHDVEQVASERAGIPVRTATAATRKLVNRHIMFGGFFNLLPTGLQTIQRAQRSAKDNN